MIKYILKDIKINEKVKIRIFTCNEFLILYSNEDFC